jgi:hypothetical protein
MENRLTAEDLRYLYDLVEKEIGHLTEVADRTKRTYWNETIQTLRELQSRIGITVNTDNITTKY